jgi:hypothetical protein
MKCGAKCTVNLEAAPEGTAQAFVYRCPNGHGIQLMIEVTPPEGDPTETGVLQWPLKTTDTDVPLATPPTTVALGSVFLIDTEYMTVTDISNIDNPAVTRATNGSVIDAHDAGAAVSIWGNAGGGTKSSKNSRKD